MKRKLLAGFLVICTALFLSTSITFAFTNVVTFGDSISDNGATLDPYGFGVYTDGSPWADQLAVLHGANMFNVAYGGATTGLGNVYAPPVGSVPADTTGLNWQVNYPGIQGVVGGMPMDSTLFTVWAGANDYNRLNALKALASEVATPAEKQAAALGAVDNIMTALGTLSSLGAQHILVPNLMLLGDGNFTLTYNDALANALDIFDDTFAGTIYTLDIYSLYYDLFDGYDMTTNEGTALAMADGLIWSDGYHPGPVAHTAMADAAFQATVPVPSALLLMSVGLISLTGISRRKTA